MGETKIKGSLMANYMKNLNTFLTSEWYAKKIIRLWCYVLDFIWATISILLAIGLKPNLSKLLFYFGIIIILLWPIKKSKPFLAHGAGCSHEKALNKNNENIIEGVK